MNNKTFALAPAAIPPSMGCVGWRPGHTQGIHEHTRTLFDSERPIFKPVIGCCVLCVCVGHTITRGYKGCHVRNGRERGAATYKIEHLFCINMGEIGTRKNRTETVRCTARFPFVR